MSADPSPALRLRRLRASAGIRAMLCAARGLSESQACHPPGCETSLLPAGSASFAQAPAGPALGAFLPVSDDTEGGGND